MATNIEIEAKALINKEEYSRLIKFYNAEKYKKTKQTNYYIDTKDLSLKKYGISLRIREKDDFVLTLKAPMAEGLLEKNETINWKEYEDFRDNNKFPECSISNFIKMLSINPKDLQILTSLVTERIEIDNFENKGKFAIDKNLFNGTIDYELELEANSLSKAQSGLKEICDQAKIEYFENHLSKETRAISSIK